MNTDDLIYVVQNQLDKDFCNHVIEKFKKDEDKYQGMIGRGVDLNVKQSMDLTISDRDNWKDEDKVFYQSLSKNIQAYKDWVPKPYEMYVCGYREIEDSGYQIQETQPGGFYRWHHDGFLNRQLTVIWYLNDVSEGGHTEFSTGFKVQPEVGKVLMFPALWPWVHRGVPPKSGVKYLCTGWVSELPLDEVDQANETWVSAKPVELMNNK